MPILTALKRLFRPSPPAPLPPLTITEEQAFEIARQECERRGWTWYRESMMAIRRGDHWRIQTRGKGANIGISIDGMTGEIRSAGRIPR